MSDLILSLDPSSSCLGWATMRPGEVYIASGRIMPGHPRTHNGYEAYGRIESICTQLDSLMDREQPTIIVVEVTSGKRAGRLGQNVSHLGIYGAAVGAVWQKATAWSKDFMRDHRIPCTVDVILENEWTSRQPKALRVATAALMFQQYHSAEDPGGDEADALMLNVWYQRERVVSRLVEAQR